MGDGDAVLLVQAHEHLRVAIAEVVHQAVLKAAITGTRHHRDIGNVELPNHFRDNIAAPAHFRVVDADRALRLVRTVNGHADSSLLFS